VWLVVTATGSLLLKVAKVVLYYSDLLGRVDELAEL